MRQHKLALFIALLFTLASLAAYLCGAFICFYRNDILKDISLAVLSSAVFVVVLSAIGYKIEKNHTLDNILVNNTSGVNEFLTSEINSNNGFTRQAYARLIHLSLEQIMKLKSCLADYYCGCIRKDNNLKNLINDVLREYCKMLSDFEVYLFSPSPREEIISTKFTQLQNSGEKMYDSVIAWLEGTAVKIGADFKYGDDFIEKYENE